MGMFLIVTKLDKTLQKWILTKNLQHEKKVFDFQVDMKKCSICKKKSHGNIEHFILLERDSRQVWTCVKYVPKQSIA